MHPAAVGERLALDPAQDLAAFVVYSEPAGRGVESDALQVEEKIADELSIRPRWPTYGVSDTDDALR
jgi:hypothetical protein